MSLIAVVQSGNKTVCIYASLRGYLGGKTEPLDFCGTGWEVSDNLAELGYIRDGDWHNVPGEPREWYCKIKAIQATH